MKEGTSRKILILLTIIVCVLAFTCACKEQKPFITLASNKTESSETTSVSTSEAAKEITPVPTGTPIPTPTAAPTPVYIPRAKLPDGRVFEEGYYAVLPGEGAYYNVFDSYGNQIDSFLFTDGEGIPPTGMFTEKTLSRYHRLNQSEVQTIVSPKPEEYENLLRSNENGFYQINYSEHKVILYNTQGEYIRTLIPQVIADDGWADIAIKCLGDETVVSFSSSTWDPENNTSTYSIAIYFISSNGTINDKCAANSLPDKPIGLLAREYFLVFLGDWETAGCAMYDSAGKLVMKDVSVMLDTSFLLWSSEAATQIFVSDYYIKDGQTYDSSFQPVEKNKVESDGRLIYGDEYDVHGIKCTAKYGKSDPVFHDYNGNSELIAVGTLNNQIAIKTQNAEYVFASNGLSYYAMNKHALVLTDTFEKYQVISLETGEVLVTLEHTNQVQVADEYILVSKGEYDPNSGRFPSSYIIDKDGSIRFMTQNAYVECSLGEYIILHRGPYAGIADLNGEWILKSLVWQLTRDAKFTYLD